MFCSHRWDGIRQLWRGRSERVALSDIPELKKLKLEIPPEKDVEMPNIEGDGGITPGASVEDSFESPVDAEIPASPSFTGKAKEIPHFDISDDDTTQVKQTQLEPENVNDGITDDELDRSAVPREAPQASAKGVAPNFPAGEASRIRNSLQDEQLIRNSMTASNSSNSTHCQGAKQPGAGIAGWAFGQNEETKTPTEQRMPYVHVNHVSEVMPPWLQEIRDNFGSLHSKADRQHQDILAFGAEVQAQGIRVTHLEHIASEHTLKHEGVEERLKALETKISQTQRDDKILDLERKLSELKEGVLTEDRDRSPIRTGLGTRNRSPSPRSPRFQSKGSDNYQQGLPEVDDLDIVIGGWSDARRNDAIEETRNIFKSIGCDSSISDIFVPYSRTTFAKVKLTFPNPDAHISLRRQHQFGILDKLRSKNFTSGVPGSAGNKIWATKSKSPEERAKIRAIVLTKAFYRNLSPGEGKPCFDEESIEISWNGKVYIDNFQLLGSVFRDGEPELHDVCIEDSRGNHMNWYIKAKIFHQVTGRPVESLQELWLSQGPTSAHTRAFN